MALRKIKGKWYCYFRTAPRRLPDGRIVPGRLSTRATGIDAENGRKSDAEAVDVHLQETERQKRYEFRLGYVTATFAEYPEYAVPASVLPLPVAPPPPSARISSNRLKLSEVLEAAGGIRPVSPSAVKMFRRFEKAFKGKCLDEISPQMALAYMTKNFKNSSGKTWNNNTNALNSICKRVLLHAGLADSPFERIPTKEDTPNHQRSLTDAEVKKLIENAAEPWRTAILISYYTGLRQKDCFTLKWSEISEDAESWIITKIPAKTSRTKRAVRVRIHPDLKNHLEQLPRDADDPRVVGFIKHGYEKSGAHTRYFADLLKKSGIDKAVDEKEIVTFNSLRNSFVSRCIQANIDLKLIQGTVGHKEGEQTVLYNDTPIPLHQLPGMK